MAHAARFDVRILGRGDEVVLENVAADVFDSAIDAVVVGFASGVHYIHPDKASEMWINEVGVSPSRQGQGVGSALIQELLRHASRIGCREAWVLTDRGNHAAMRLYASTGAREATGEQVMFTYVLDKD